MIESVLPHFEYQHLPPHLHEVAKPFRDLAWLLVQESQGSSEFPLPPGQDRHRALQKLLDSRDAAVSARMFVPRAYANAELWAAPARKALGDLSQKLDACTEARGQGLPLRTWLPLVSEALPVADTARNIVKPLREAAQSLKEFREAASMMTNLQDLAASLEETLGRFDDFLKEVGLDEKAA